MRRVPGEQAAGGALVRHTEGISSAAVIPPSKGSAAPVVQTAGVNFAAMCGWTGANREFNQELASLVDLPSITSNDIWAVRNFYGVEVRICGRGLLG